MSDTEFIKRTGNFEDFYQFGRTLGQGNFAVCRLATHKPTKTQWAVKVINKATLEPEDLKSLDVEIEILSRVKHPYIVSLLLFAIK
jgi:serine/threonine protein kinase